MKIIIADALKSQDIIKEKLVNEFPTLVNSIFSTNTYEDLIEMANNDEEVVIITSSSLRSRNKIRESTEELKYKLINKKVRIYLFSSQFPESFTNYDGYFSKIGTGDANCLDLISIMYKLNLPEIPKIKEKSFWKKIFS